MIDLAWNFPPLSENTPEQWLEQNAEIDRWQLEQDEITAQHNFMNCGASKKLLETVGFENYVMLNSIGDVYLAQQVLKNCGLEFLRRIKLDEYVNLVLMGKPGIGKTFLSLCIVKEVCKLKRYEEVQGYPVEYFEDALYRTSDRLCEEFKYCDNFKSRFKKYDLVEAYGTCKLLVIDEIGRSNRKDEGNVLFQILDKRYQERKPSILLSNYETKVLSDYLGEALVDRLAESEINIKKETLDLCPSMREAKSKHLF